MTRKTDKKRGRRLAPDQRRLQLIDSALGVFARRGYAGAGTRDLARAAGVTEPVLYRHFDGKAGLFCAVLEEVQARLVAELGAGETEHGGAAARLAALAERLPELLERRRDELRVLNAATLAHEEPAIRAAAGRCAGAVGGTLARLFRGSGLRRGISADTAGFLLLEVGMGAAMLMPLELPELEKEGYRDRAVSALLGGIAAARRP